jgi:hypothetical protein
VHVVRIARVGVLERRLREGKTQDTGSTHMKPRPHYFSILTQFKTPGAPCPPPVCSQSQWNRPPGLCLESPHSVGRYCAAWTLRGGIQIELGWQLPVLNDPGAQPRNRTAAASALRRLAFL